MADASADLVAALLPNIIFVGAAILFWYAVWRYYTYIRIWKVFAKAWRDKSRAQDYFEAAKSDILANHAVLLAGLGLTSMLGVVLLVMWKFTQTVPDSASAFYKVLLIWAFGLPPLVLHDMKRPEELVFLQQAPDMRSLDVMGLSDVRELTAVIDSVGDKDLRKQIDCLIIEYLIKKLSESKYSPPRQK